MTNSVEFAGHSGWPASWSASNIGEKATFARAREQTINLVQWLARIGNSYVEEPLPEDRIVLNWRPNGAFITKAFDRDIAVELRLPSLEMQFQEKGIPVPHILDPEDHSPAEVEAWILVELLHRRLDRDRFSKSLPYTINNLISGDAEKYSPHACASGVVRLLTWFRAAASSLANKGSVLCLPQSLMLTVAARRGSPPVGFSPGDAGCDEPYFFAGNAEKRRLLMASDLAGEARPATAVAHFINSAPEVGRA